MTRRFDLKKLQQLKRKLLDAGWKEVKTDVGRSFAKRDESECLVLNVHEMERTDRIKAEMDWFVDFTEITKVVNRIFPNPLRDLQPLTASGFHPDQNFQFDVENGREFTDDDASECIRRVHSWRQSYSPQREIEKLAKSPVPDVGGGQLLHLAALAYLADYDTLLDYQKIFRQGQRLNFVPMITSEMIDRAVHIGFETLGERYHQF